MAIVLGNVDLEAHLGKRAQCGPSVVAVEASAVQVPDSRIEDREEGAYPKVGHVALVEVWLGGVDGDEVGEEGDEDAAVDAVLLLGRRWCRGHELSLLNVG